MQTIWRRSLNTLLVALLACVPFVFASGAGAEGRNVQEGDNTSMTTQDGSGTSGDAVAGQVAGVDSGGSASVDATNSTDRSSASSGDAKAANAATETVGLSDESSCGTTADTADLCPAAGDVFSPFETPNSQEGDNKVQTNQNANAVSGGAVAGGVIGVVTSGGGSADLVLANGTANSDAESGDSQFTNDSIIEVGLHVQLPACCPLPADVAGPVASSGINV